MLDTQFSLRKADGCGAYVEDVDLARLSEAEAARLRQALFAHGVLYFRNQVLSPAQHIALAEQLGTIDVNRYFPSDPAYPTIAKVEKTREQTDNIGGGWHTDHSYDVAPAIGSILVARDLPPHGGDTLFADLCDAYETLDAATKSEISGLRAIHSTRHVFGQEGGYADSDQSALASEAVELPETVHPVVIRHPGSGRPTLYVNPGFTVGFEGWSRDESQPLLARLFAHAIQPERVHRFVWEPGSVAFWDNRATWHFALNDYQGYYRLMHRITLGGDVLMAA